MTPGSAGLPPGLGLQAERRAAPVVAVVHVVNLARIHAHALSHFAPRRPGVEDPQLRTAEEPPTSADRWGYGGLEQGLWVRVAALLQAVIADLAEHLEVFADPDA